MSVFCAARSQLLVVDMQERLLPAMAERELAEKNTTVLLHAARRLGVPVILSEQYPERLGASSAAVREAAGNISAFAKMSFSCARDAAIAAQARGLRGEGRGQLVICGVETHVCVMQSALDFTEAGFDVCVVRDAASSRAPASHEAALERLGRAGVTLATTEMIVFEWLERAGTADFKALQPLIK